MPQWYNIAAEAPWLVEKQQYPAGSGITSFFQGLTSGFQQAQDEKQKRDDFNYEVDQAGFTGPGAQHAGRNYFREVVKGYLGAGMVPTNLEDQQKVLNQQLTLQHIKGVGLQNVQQAITNENMLQVRGGMAAYGQMFNDISQLPNGWADPQAKRLLGEFVKKYPYMPDKLINQTEGWMDKAVGRDLALQRLQDQATFRDIQLAIAQQRIDLLKDRAAAGGDTAAMKEVNQFETTKAQYDAAIQKGDEAEIKRLGGLLQTMGAKFFPKEDLKVFSAEGQPMFEMSKGGLPGGLMPGTATQAQQQIMGMKQSVTQMEDLSHNLRDEDVGIAGKVGEFFGDRLIPQISPSTGTMSAVRVKNRTELRTAIQSLIGTLSQHARLTKQEMDQLKEIAPSAAWEESGPRARQSAFILTQILKKRAQDSAEQGKQPVEPWMLTVKDIATQLRAGQLKPETASPLVQPNDISMAVRSGNITTEDGIYLRRVLFPTLYRDTKPPVIP